MSVLKFNEWEATPDQLREEASEIDDIAAGIRRAMERGHVLLMASAGVIEGDLLRRGAEFRVMARLKDQHDQQIAALKEGAV